MRGDVHVRICEGLGVKFPRATRLDWKNFCALSRNKPAMSDWDRRPLSLLIVCTDVPPSFTPKTRNRGPSCSAFARQRTSWTRSSELRWCLSLKSQ